MTVLRTLLCALLPLTSVFAAPPSVEDFARFDQFSRMTISPTGEYLAATAERDGENILLILDRETMKVTAAAKQRDSQQVAEYFWVGPDRIIYSTAGIYGALAQPLPDGDLIGINADGSNHKLIYGPEVDHNAGSTLFSRKETVFGLMVSVVREQAKYALITSYEPSGNAEGNYPLLRKINVRSGLPTTLYTNPVRNGRFMTDFSGEVVAAFGTEADLVTKILVRDQDSDWKQIASGGGGTGMGLYPVAFNADGSELLVVSEQKTGPDIVEALNVASGERRLVMAAQATDPIYFARSLDGREIIGAYYQPDTPRFVPFGTHPDAELLRSVQASFKNRTVELASASWDGKSAIIEVSGDRFPGEYYLLDVESKKLSFVAARRPWLKAEALGESIPFDLQARDGRALKGFLTVPPGAELKNLPMVVMPHGGPHGPFDFDIWGFDAWAQLLASRGYAVLQVNFRGSNGYGREHVAAGYQEWGGTMIDDMVDATRWTIAQGIVDGKRICSAGASYGGYASLMLAIREPELFQCVIDYVGVTDLEMMYSHGDIEDSTGGVNYMEKVIGKDKEDLRNQSPVNRLSTLKAPVFIAHGGADKRVPIEHAKALRSRLDSSGHPNEWMVETTEGHGFYKEANRAKFYQRTLAFLEKYIGAQGGSAAPAETSTE